MSHSSTPILVGVASPVLEILLLSKTAKFPFRPMDYSLWSSKNLIDWNQLKKFMQIGIDVTFKHTNFGGSGFSSFGDHIILCHTGLMYNASRQRTVIKLSLNTVRECFSPICFSSCEVFLLRKWEGPRWAWPTEVTKY